MSYEIDDLSNKIEDLRCILSPLAERGTIVIACSGGVDSRFLAHIAHDMGFNVELIHANGPHMPKKETEMLRQWATGAEDIQGIGKTTKTTGVKGRKNSIFPLHEVYYSPLILAQVKHNTKERCYHCKYALFSAMLAYCQQYIPNAMVCDGSHHSDKRQFRPGIRALGELGINSPLALAGFEKSHIRALALETNMERPFQHSKACLFTRFDYGRILTEVDLEFVAHVEEIVETFLLQYYNEKDMPEFRVREVAPQEFILHTSADIPKFSVLQTILLQNTLFKIEMEIVSNISGYFDKK